MTHLQYADFFKDSDAAESAVVINELNANDLFLTVRSSDTVDLTVKGLTDDTEDVSENWLTMRVMDMQTFEMADSIEATGQYGIALGAVGRIKIENSGGQVTVFGIFGNK